MSRHQAGIVAIQLDEIQDEGEAEEEDIEGLGDPWARLGV